MLETTTPNTTTPADKTGKKPLINCHAHVFTGDHVPPYLARTFLPLRLDVLLHIPTLLGLVRWWYNGPGRWPYRPWARNLSRFLYQCRMFLVRNYITMVFINLLTVYTLFMVYNWFPRQNFWPFTWLNRLLDGLLGWWPGMLNLHPFFQALIYILVTLLYPSGRKAINFLISNIWKLVKKLPGPKTKEMLQRYWNIVRFARYIDQGDGLERLRAQYPESSAFVLLPMDMEFMQAGKPKLDYYVQMEGLQKLKKNHPKTALPFIFADPRRFDADPGYFSWSEQDGEMTLNDCIIKKYLKEYQFNGIKIYPALGYYPFDARLLPLWKYAADNGIPLMTHCVRGPMFYRGSKKPEWDQHPIFKQVTGKNMYGPLLLPQMTNAQFSANFTHPMNYLCLLDETLLARVLATAPAPVQRIFDYTPGDAAVKPGKGLRHLKICLAHFGGGDEWLHYFETDRYGYGNQLAQHPETGIDFFHNTGGVLSEAKLEQLWKYCDWYSIICSMLLQYPHVYADISYILHDDEGVLPLLKQTLKNPALRNKVLYGTDFFVVRNHKSDKNMLTDMMGGLEEPDFDVIARTNPRKYLETKLHGELLV